MQLIISILAISAAALAAPVAQVPGRPASIARPIPVAPASYPPVAGRPAHLNHPIPVGGSKPLRVIPVESPLQIIPVINQKREANPEPEPQVPGRPPSIARPIPVTPASYPPIAGSPAHLNHPIPVGGSKPVVVIPVESPLQVIPVINQ
ncbi:hypothetical protein QBC35DRAFT_552200 [Podospora australis]|uniref:Uncharacterized protein n=1 Tax=Podospora australis TaxID=1536484 RepID=A0AAN7AIM4_9PEZI|nr:hypothetical protein QBC35DRAFT_552200 [Podospora australis]